MNRLPSPVLGNINTDKKVIISEVKKESHPVVKAVVFSAIAAFSILMIRIRNAK